MNVSSRTATLAGLAAVVLWSTAFGLWRVATESLGVVTTGMAIYLLGGLVGCAWALRSRAARQDMARLPRRYLLGCGGLFITYNVCMAGAIGLAAGRQQVLEVGLINYLWPAATLVLSIPLLHRRPRASLAAGVLLCVGGLVLMTTGELRWSAFVAGVRANALPYALALVAAVSWGLYSNLARRWAAQVAGGGVGLFLLGGGLLMAALLPVAGESPRPTAAALAAVVYLGGVEYLLACMFWDLAVRRGNLTLVASAGYLTPLLSTLFSCLVLGIWPSLSLWAACGLIIAGAVICKLSLR